MPAASQSNGHLGSSSVPSRLYSIKQPPSLSDFDKLCSQTISKEDYPLSQDIQKNIPIYDLHAHSSASASTISALQDEWNHILLSGPGVFVLKHLYTDHSLLEQVNAVFSSIIESERSAGARGDHFAAGGKNDRIWNSFAKHCLADPASFAAYYANPWLAAACEAWLGPAYRLTAQVNLVRPGGQPQVSHRDFHLGFQAAEACARFPKAAHAASQLLTLQGAVAHSAMPLDAGPTRFLPFSQRFEGGYVAYRLPEFDAYFLDHYVSLPLEMGDAVFFNPGLHHAAGQNQTADVQRSANLLQVCSAFGKTMETVETVPLVERCWEGLRGMYEEEGLSPRVRALVAAVGEGYPFPTNLDRRHPSPEGMSPESEQEFLVSALQGGLGKEEVLGTLKRMRDDSRQ